MSIFKQITNWSNYKKIVVHNGEQNKSNLKAGVGLEEVVLVDEDEMYLFFHSRVIANTIPGITIRVFKKFDDAFIYLKSHAGISRLIIVEPFYQPDECLLFLKKVESVCRHSEVIVASTELPKTVIQRINNSANVLGLLHKPIREKHLEPYIY